MRFSAAAALVAGSFLVAAPAAAAVSDRGPALAQEEEDPDDLRVEGEGPMPDPGRPNLADTGPASPGILLGGFALLLTGASLVALGREPRRAAVLRWKAAELDGWDPMVDRWTEALRSARSQRARYPGWTLRAPRTDTARDTFAENES